MKKVLICVSAGLVLLAILNLATTTRNRERAEMIPARELPVVDKSESVVGDSYRQGYVRGYNAFLAQTETYMPLPAIAYTSSHPDAPEEGQGMDGYVDGYHKAAESVHCPR